MIFRVFDLETTGLPEQDKTTAVIQIGWTDLDFDEAGGAVRSIGDPVQFLVNPMRANPTLRIETGAKATHHIIEDDLADAVSVDEGFRRLAGGSDAFACHNREHDGHYFTGAGRPIICTLKAAKVIWPDPPALQRGEATASPFSALSRASRRPCACAPSITAKPPA